MRIISGIHKGRQLKPVKGNNIRPTSDMVREAIFSALAEKIVDSCVLDLFAGTGALGIEALSRGARHVTFVDRDPVSLNLIKANLQLVGEIQKSTILKGDVFRVCERLGRQSLNYDIILADPPYRASFHNNLAALIKEHNLLGANGVMVYETESQFQFNEVISNSYSRIKEKKYGDTKAWFFYH